LSLCMTLTFMWVRSMRIGSPSGNKVVVGRNWPVLVKFWILYFGSLTIALLVYELLVRRIGALRLLFDMRNKGQGRPGNRKDV
jgi:hypothetical protein